ncbi:hypothetical protein [Myceligenerans pegani]|uniref:Uncharacterized protein n=1 Tax=Myceligenerans pegani TaxID=2776917 RepID=A0ABR9N0J7_9MICO|nr:hypothetical protein [Myceligenerans sp. TRM 65318]MBE1876684.1 hypothetical protein [Myceligenerans sp. TRM 65318]MBE3018955.1 hypothetical protein [Myceligenerans sp. TRM 65318]
MPTTMPCTTSGNQAHRIPRTFCPGMIYPGRTSPGLASRGVVGRRGLPRKAGGGPPQGRRDGARARAGSGPCGGDGGPDLPGGIGDADRGDIRG